MEGPKHIYFLYNPENSMFLYVENDLVKEQGAPTMLEFNPGGWEELPITNTRNLKYWGIDRSFTPPLDFYETASKIVKWGFYNYGTEFRTLLIIMEQKLFYDGTEYGFYYDEFYKGELDFSKFNHTGPTATLNIMEGGWSQILKDQETTTFQYKANDSSMYRIFNDGVLLKQKASFIVTNGNVLQNSGAHTISLILIGSEDISNLGATTQERVVVSNATSSLWDSGIRFITNGEGTVNVDIDWDFTVIPELADGTGQINPTNIIFRIEVLLNRDTPGTAFFQRSTISDPTFLYTHPYHFVGTTTITIPAGARLVAYMTANQNAPFTFFSYPTTGTLNANYSYRKAPTYIKGFDLLDIGRKIVQSMSNGEYTLQSSLLSDVNFRIAITSVDCIRLFNDPIVKISWKAWWDFVNTIHDVGLYVMGKVVYVETKESMVDYNDYIDIGELSGPPKITPNTDLIPSSLQIGFPNEKYENVNGLQEFNTTQEYKLPISKIKNELIYVGTIRTDSYGIEFLRITLDGKPTTDDEYDGNLFAIHLQPLTHTHFNENALYEDMYEVDRSLNQYASGLLTRDTVYNIKLSPKHCFFRKENYLKSCLYWRDSKTITYQNQDKNANMIVSDPLDRVIDEDSNVLVSDLSRRYFLPVQCEGQAISPENYQQIVEANPKKTVKATIDGMPYFFLPIKTGSDQESNKDQSFLMLFAPGTDFTNLQDYYG